METKVCTTRQVTIDDYDQLFELWNSTEQSRRALNPVDDSREGIERYLKRNPNTCFAAVKDGRIIGVILTGHDGRRGIIHQRKHHAGHDGRNRRQARTRRGRRIAGNRSPGSRPEAYVRIGAGSRGPLPLRSSPGYSSSSYPIRLSYLTKKSRSILSLMGIGSMSSTDTAE